MVHFEELTRPKVPTEERLLYFDGASPHLAPLVISYAFTHGITVANYPSHSSDFLSALDVAVFSPAAHFYPVDLDVHVDGGGRVNKKAFTGILAAARKDYIKPTTIITGFRKAGTWPIDPSAIPFVKEHLDAEERRRLDSPFTRSSSLYPPSSSHPLNTSASQLPLTPNRRRTRIIAISKAFQQRENVQPDDDLTTANALVSVLTDQVERDEVQVAHSAVRKKQFDRENGTSEAEVGDRIILKKPEHGGVVFIQGNAILEGTLRTAALIKKEARKRVVGGGVGKKGGKGRGERSFGKEMSLRAGRMGGRVSGGVRGGGRRKARAVLEESSSDSSMDVDDEENEGEKEEEEVLSRAVVRAVPKAVGVKKRVGREKKDLSRFWTYKWVPREEDETMEETTDEGAGGSVEVMGHRLRAK